MSNVFLPPYFHMPVGSEQMAKVKSDIRDWGFMYMNAAKWHDEGYRGKGVVVFVIDTGIDQTHEDIKGRVIFAHDFTGEGTGDKNGHGTWCASRIGSPINGLGVVGIAPECHLADLKVLGAGGGGSSNNVAAAYRMAADIVLPPEYQDLPRITSASLGAATEMPQVEAAMKYAADKGVIHFAAAGNAGYQPDRNTMNWPARYDALCIAVGALQEGEEPAPYSSAGEELDVTAPGSRLIGAYKDGGYAYLYGTSMATPHVAALGALILDRYDGAITTVQQMELYIEKHAKDLLEEGWDARTGHGAVVLTNYETPPGGTPPDEPAPDPVDPPTGGKLVLRGVNLTIEGDFELKYD